MPMDVTKECHHCRAPEGVMCYENCAVNGDKIKALRSALKELNLYMTQGTRFNTWEVESYHSTKVVNRTSDYNEEGRFSHR